MDDIVSSQSVRPKIAEDENSLQVKQWTPTGAGPMVPEEEEEGVRCAADFIKAKVLLGRLLTERWMFICAPVPVSEHMHHCVLLITIPFHV